MVEILTLKTVEAMRATVCSECHDTCTCVPIVLGNVWLCYRLLSQGDTKSESGYHYYQDLLLSGLLQRAHFYT